MNRNVCNKIGFELRKFVFLILIVLLSVSFLDKFIWGSEEIGQLLKSLNSGQLRIEERNEIRNKILSFDKKVVTENIINEAFSVKDFEENAYYLVELKVLLQRTGKAGIDATMNMLQDQNYERIWWFGLATLSSPPQVEVSETLKQIISNMLLSKIPQNRKAAARAITSFQIKDYVPAVIELSSKETDNKIKRDIVTELGRMDDAKAREFIVNILKSEDANLRLAACVGLSEVKSKISPELLVKIAANDPDNRVRVQAIEAAANTGDAKTLPFLKKILDSAILQKDGPMMTHVFNVMPKIKDRKTVNLLGLYLNSDDPYVRFNSALAIGKSGLKEAAPILLKGLNDSDMAVKKQAIRSLGWIGSPESLEILQKSVLSERDENVKNEIQKAIKSIKSGGKKWD